MCCFVFKILCFYSFQKYSLLLCFSKILCFFSISSVCFPFVFILFLSSNPLFPLIPKVFFIIKIFFHLLLPETLIFILMPKTLIYSSSVSKTLIFIPVTSKPNFHLCDLKTLILNVCDFKP